MYSARNTFLSLIHILPIQRRIQVFKLGRAHLKKLRRAEGGAKIFGVFRVKNYDFTPKNHIFSNCRGRCENFWGISCEKSRFYAKKSYFFPILGRTRPPWIRPCYMLRQCTSIPVYTIRNKANCGCIYLCSKEKVWIMIISQTVHILQMLYRLT